MRIITLGLICAGALMIAGCKDTNRPLSYTKGEYGGKPDTKLTGEQVETLRHRGLRSYR